MVGVEVMVSLGQPIDKGGGFAIGDRPNFDPAAERTDFKVHSIPQELVDTVRNRFAVNPGSIGAAQIADEQFRLGECQEAVLATDFREAEPQLAIG